MPASGTMSAAALASGPPPSRWNTCPAACTVNTRIAMLNSVRNSGFGVREFSVVWLQPLAAPTIIVACGPRSMSAAMSTTYDTDMFDPLAIGNCTLKADVSDDSSTKTRRGTTGAIVARGRRATKVTAPSAITARMYHRPRGGRSESKSTQVYFSQMKTARGKRGRPPKFGRPGQFVALTLPEEVVAGLRRIDADLAWAVVRLFEKEARRAPAARTERAIAELVTI